MRLGELLHMLRGAVADDRGVAMVVDDSAASAASRLVRPRTCASDVLRGQHLSANSREQKRVKPQVDVLLGISFLRLQVAHRCRKARDHAFHPVLHALHNLRERVQVPRIHLD
eukprot:CAMPEP_0170443834 /NCGR_PEP_ID=MMETSP0117_2-20130122/48193_1 /TAXON_ID=400756 /ORGANISM="Durinskia baltica, Strain CSIRO CS-38" /LENGTH=112 /DNA_ID=CAMNT_0010704577 /DNA_START=234 /DNA_END=569 /DNA_ORIENTATION=-